METSATPASQPTRQARPARGLFYHLQVVIGVAFVLATLFTAWSPSDLVTPPPQSNLIYSSPPQSLTPVPQDGPTPTTRSRPLIGIVAGHSGNDSGAVCSDGLTEEFVNTTVAGYVKKYLTEQGLDVDILKEFDPQLTGYKASALVSIHADSCDYINDSATGFKVAAALSNPHPEQSARLTACIRSRYAQVTGLPLHSTSVTTDMSSYHAFGEIDEYTPAAIIETGFLNLDRQLLEKHPDVVAQGIAQGILCFIHNEDITSPTVQPTAQTTPPAP